MNEKEKAKYYCAECFKNGVVQELGPAHFGVMGPPRYRKCSKHGLMWEDSYNSGWLTANEMRSKISFAENSTDTRKRALKEAGLWQ